MQVKEILCKSILNISQICDYCINPYAGCQHACIYCYARFASRFVGKNMKEWGSFVMPKINAAEILTEQAKNKRQGSIYMSSITDAYQPLEEKYMLTRKILEILLKYKNKFSLTIQTKSSLVERDIDLIKKFQAEVGFTLTCDDEKAREIEPFSSPPSERIKTLKKLHEEGIKTYVFLGPILPFFTDSITLIKSTYEHADYFYFDKLNLRPGVWQNMNQFLKKHNLLKKYKEIFFYSSDFYKKEKEKIKNFCKANNIKHVFCF